MEVEIYDEFAMADDGQEQYDALIPKLFNYTKPDAPPLDEDDVARSAEVLAIAKRLRKAIEKERKRRNEGAQAVIRQVNHEAAELHAPLTAAIDVIEDRVKTFLQEKAAAEAAAAQEAAEVRTDNEPEGLNLEPLPAAPPPTTKVTGVLGSTSALRENWQAELVDFSKVPPAYLVSEEDRIRWPLVRAAIRGKDGAREIPGFKIYDAGSVHSR